MTILYHLATLPPKMPQAEAISQEITAVRARFGGEVIYVNPNQAFFRYIPRLFFGFHKLRELRAREVGVQFHHFYNPDPFPFHYLRTLQRPVVYSVTCGIRDKRPNIPYLSSLAVVAASDQRSLDLLKSWGLENTALLQPGIDTTRFTHSPVPLKSTIMLMVGSAPWTRGQFHTKGVEALLAAAQQDLDLNLTFLWRGVLADEMQRKVDRLNLGDRVSVFNRQVDVNQVLTTVHASIVLATDPAIIKSYPHSLLDSLAAGKPVLVSRAIPMADYVEETGCGQVVEAVTPASILEAIEALRRTYNAQRQLALQVGCRDFSQQAMLASYQQLYRQIL